ncbi:uncharacterized protein [Primulina huaijiensis]|uniref:uncharacterized protein isoform X1 n=1 Tax=Primulina huaijiensis TaxID=1492673 RepID=UPI003CC70951
MGQFRYGCLSAKKRVSDVAFSNESVVCAVQRLALVWGYSSRSSPPFFSSLIPSVSCPFSSIRCVHCLVFFEPPSACHQFFSKVLYVVQSPSLQKAAASLLRSRTRRPVFVCLCSGGVDAHMDFGYLVCRLLLFLRCSFFLTSGSFS